LNSSTLSQVLNFGTMGHAIVKGAISFADYLVGERDGDTKHEWFDGAVYAMSRGTPEHARLSARILRLVGNALPSGARSTPLT
jgi:hypothetical protein